MKTIYRGRLLATTMMVGASLLATPALAQQAGDDLTVQDVKEPVLGDPADAVDDSTADTGRAEIVVTGSRIARPNLESSSPIAVVTGEQTTANADVTLDTFLNTLPGVNPAGTSTSNNPGNGGQSNINMRGLGSNRNLVLIDGRRPMVSGIAQTVDLNTIPQGLIERIEVITGGAGAAYGADAIAGVANIILRKNFQGLELRATYSNTIPEKDAMEYQISGLLGANFDDGRGNIAVAVEYSDRQALIKSQRPFAAQATSTTGVPPTGRLIEAGNNIPQAAIASLFNSYGIAPSQHPLSGLSQLHFNRDGTLFGAGTFNNPLDVANYRYDPLGTDSAAANQNFFPDFYSYNFDAINILVLPLKRKSFMTRGHYEIDPHAEVFFSGGYTEYRSAQALAPTPIGTRIYNPGNPGGTQFATSPLICGAGSTVAQGCGTATAPTGAGTFITNSVIPVTNPFIPADLAALLAQRTGNDLSLVGSGATEPFRFGIRTLAIGLRQTNIENQVLQGLAGLRGEIIGDWRYEAYYSYGKTKIDNTATGNVNVQRLQTLLEAPDGGNSICAGGYNPFGIQPVSQACVDYLDETGFTSTVFTQKVAQGYVTGTIIDLPAGPMKSVLGVENRRFHFAFDPGALSGPIAGFNTANPVEGRNSFMDVFGELYVPILKDSSLARSLDLTLGYRTSKSEAKDIIKDVDSKSRRSDAYKAEVSYEPIDQLRLRASYQRSVRAANFSELFQGGASFVSVFDPCSAKTNFRTSGGDTARDFCIRHGVGGGTPATVTPTASQITAANNFAATPGAQVNTNFLGNPDLKPESADTWTAGGVFQALGITGSLDYYNIRIKDTISGVDTNMMVAACYGYLPGYNSNLSATDPYCLSVRRSGSNLSSVSVRPEIGGSSNGSFLTINGGKVKTSGLDLQLAYKLPTDFLTENSQLMLDFYGNYLIDFKREELPGVTLDYAGTVSYFGQGLGSSFPRWKGLLNAAWQMKPFTFSTRVRYIDAMKNRAGVQFAGEEDQFTGVGSVWYFDFAAQADFENRLSLRIGLNNAFDRQPPTYAPNVQSGTDPSLYDVVGRRAYVSARVRF